MSGYQGGVVTPEAVVVHHQYAGPGNRVLARGLDTLLQAAALIGFAVLLQWLSGGSLGTAGVVVFLFALPLIVFGYPAIMEAAWRGRTLGKAAFRLRVVTKEGAPVRFRHSVVRSMLYLVDGIILGPTIGVILLLATRDTVRLGDLATGTVVLREGSGANMPAPVSFHSPTGFDEYASRLDVSGLSPGDYEVVRAFLLRAPTLKAESRWRVAVDIATPVAAKIRCAVPPEIHPETFLHCVAASYQQRQAGYWPARSSTPGPMVQSEGGGFAPPS